jgi:ankyrin repeat protein
MSKSNNPKQNNKVYNDTSVKLLYYCVDNKSKEALSILNNDEIIEYLNYNLVDPEYKSSAFIWACVNEMTYVIDKLIDISNIINDMTKNNKTRSNLKFDINQQDIYGKTALMYLCIGKMYDQFAKLIDSYSGCYMLDYNQGGTQCTTGDLDLKIKDNNGNNVLRIAVENNNIYLVEKILKWIDSYNINIPANDGNTPLMIAIKDNRIDLVEILLQKIDINVLLKNNELGIIYEKAKEYCPDCLPEIYRKIMHSIDKLSDKKLEILIQITQNHASELNSKFLPELYKGIEFKTNRNNLISLDKNFIYKKKNLKTKTNTRFSSVYYTTARKEKKNAKKKYNIAEKLLKDKIEEILIRIKSNQSKQLNGYQKAMIKIINEILTEYSFTEYFSEYSTILQNP